MLVRHLSKLVTYGSLGVKTPQMFHMGKKQLILDRIRCCNFLVSIAAEEVISFTSLISFSNVDCSRGGNSILFSHIILLHFFTHFLSHPFIHFRYVNHAWSRVYRTSTIWPKNNGQGGSNRYSIHYLVKKWKTNVIMRFFICLKRGGSNVALYHTSTYILTYC